MSNLIQRAQIAAESATTLLARIVDATGAALVQAALTSITVKVFDKTTTLQTGTYTPTVSTTIFNTLQTNAIWTQDSQGYNFAYTVPSTAFPSGDTTYRVEILITPQGGNPFYLLYELQAQSIFSQ